MKTWEYRLLIVDENGWAVRVETESEGALLTKPVPELELLTTLGHQGWEMCGIQGTRIYLKRERR
jgi:hypothetical protein